MLENMPRTYRHTDGTTGISWSCRLKVQQCMAMTSRNTRCGRRTFRHPFCLQHLRSQLGLDLRPSSVHGCGLFTIKAFHPGDVLIPYTGERVSPAEFRENAYNYQLLLPAGIAYDDASCLRGAAAYANSSMRRAGVPANATAVQAKITQHHAFVAQEDSSSLLHVAAKQLRAPPRKWRRIPKILVDLFRDKSYIWLVANRYIPSDTEIFLDYNGANIVRMVHRTTPRPC